jgi:hypothetical protein
LQAQTIRAETPALFKTEHVNRTLALPEPFAIKQCGKGGNPLSMPRAEKAVAAWRLLIDALGILEATPEQWTEKMRFGSASLNKNWKAAMLRAGDNAMTKAKEAGANAEALHVFAPLWWVLSTGGHVQPHATNHYYRCDSCIANFMLTEAGNLIPLGPPEAMKH